MQAIALGTFGPQVLHTEEEASAVHLLLRVVSYARIIGAVPQESDEAGADNKTFTDAVEGLARLGIAQHANHLRPRDRTVTAAEVSHIAAAVLAAIDGSPLPTAEWAPISQILGDQLHHLLDISPSSEARYRSGERATPDVVAARLHLIAQVVADLFGSYNEFGIRRWFDRPRQALDQQAPNDILAGNWKPEDPKVQEVRHLAGALLGATIG